jgi:hypothetical protein
MRVTCPERQNFSPVLENCIDISINDQVVGMVYFS